MQKLFLQISYIFLIIFSLNIYANECPKDCYDFGEKIQTIIKAKDLKALFALVDGELQSGPRKKDIENKKFDEVFNQKFIDLVLEEDCWQRNEDNFALGSDLIWFNKKLQITSINLDFKKPINKELPIGWRVNNKMLGYQCFTYPWMSQDNYKAFLEALEIKESNLENFIENPGLYIKPNSKLLRPITPYGEILNFAPPLDQCFIKDNQFTIKDTKIVEKDIEFCNCENNYDDYESSYIYEIIGLVSNNKCQKLAPYFNGKCKESYLIKLATPAGGSIGRSYNSSIYGLFELKGGKNIIIPLKRFANENLGLNFIEEKE